MRKTRPPGLGAVSILAILGSKRVRRSRWQSRSVIGAGFALPRDAGPHRETGQRSAVQAVPALRCNRRYAVLAACGPRCWPVLLARRHSRSYCPSLLPGDPGTSRNCQHFWVDNEVLPGGQGPGSGPIFLRPAERVRLSRGGFPQNVDNVDNPTARASGVRNWGPFIETGGGLEFRRNTRTGWIVDSGYLIVRRPRGP